MVVTSAYLAVRTCTYVVVYLSGWLLLIQARQGNWRTARAIATAQPATVHPRNRLMIKIESLSGACRRWGDDGRRPVPGEEGRGHEGAPEGNAAGGRRDAGHDGQRGGRRDDDLAAVSRGRRRRPGLAAWVPGGGHHVLLGGPVAGGTN